MISRLSLNLTSQCQLLAIGKTIDFENNHMVNPMMAPIIPRKTAHLMHTPKMFSSFWVYLLYMRPTE